MVSHTTVRSSIVHEEAKVTIVGNWKARILERTFISNIYDFISFCHHNCTSFAFSSAFHFIPYSLIQIPQLNLPLMVYFRISEQRLPAFFFTL